MESTVIIDSKQVNLSSYSATYKNGSSNSVLYFQLNGLLHENKDVLYNLVSVTHCEIPISYYIVNSTNNYISLSTGNYTLTNGNYNATNFSTMLISIIGSDYSLTLNTATGIFTLSNSATDFTVNNTSTCYRIMGFASNTSYTSSSKSLTFPYPCNFLGVQKLKISSDILSVNNYDSNTNGRCDTLATIPVSVPAYGLLVYQNIYQFKSILSNKTLDYIDLSVTDEYDNDINFNGIDWNITLTIDSIRVRLPEDNNLLKLFEKDREVVPEENI